MPVKILTQIKDIVNKFLSSFKNMSATKNNKIVTIVVNRGISK